VSRSSWQCHTISYSQLLCGADEDVAGGYSSRTTIPVARFLLGRGFIGLGVESDIVISEGEDELLASEEDSRSSSVSSADSESLSRAL
jgi:hypothetical protein